MKAKVLLLAILLATTAAIFISGAHVFALSCAFVDGIVAAIYLDDAGLLRWSKRVTISRDDSGKWRVSVADGVG